MYDILGCVEDGAWMLWENSSAAVAAAVAHPGLKKLLEFHYGIGASGLRGSIRLVERLPKVICTSKNQHTEINYQKRVGQQIQKRLKTGIA